jgi:hypothetical protein
MIEQTRRKAIEQIKFWLGLIGVVLILTILVIIDGLSAQSIYPGETINIDSGLSGISNFNISGNLTPLTMFQVNDSYINITIPTDYEPSNFTITFYGYNNEVLNTEIGAGGSGGSYVDGFYNKNQTNQSPNKSETPLCVSNSGDINKQVQTGSDTQGLNQDKTFGIVIAVILIIGCILFYFVFRRIQ